MQLRLADFQFKHAQTFAEIQTLHAAFVETFNTTWHWAHQERADHRRTPEEVLGWVRGRAVDLERLRRLFGQVQFLRTVNLYGFISIQRFYIYAEPGLSRQRVSIWIAEGQLHIEYRETLWHGIAVRMISAASACARSVIQPCTVRCTPRHSLS